jgi:hypothetical protein
VADETKCPKCGHLAHESVCGVATGWPSRCGCRHRTLAPLFPGMTINGVEIPNAAPSPPPATCAVCGLSETEGNHESAHTWAECKDKGTCHPFITPSPPPAPEMMSDE